ncbi:MAG: cell wall anchor protein [Opitutaceae bacterium]|jgi:hypothetical protein|nr:cell wall anchor protein [Opitutaceae bacterium]
MKAPKTTRATRAILRNAILPGAIITAGSLVLPFHAAAMSAYENFDAYAVDATLLDGVGTGGAGWTSAWSGTGTATVAVSATAITKTIDGFTYGGGNSLAISGNSSTNAAQRLFANPQLTDGTDIYVSFLAQYTDGTSTGAVATGPFISVGLLDSSNSTAVDNFVLLNSANGQVGARVNNVSTSIAATTYQLIYDTPVLVVARFSGWDAIENHYTTTTVWVNPTGADLGNTGISVTATSTAAGSDGAGGLIIRTYNLDAATVLLDDLRVGTTWTSVVALSIPEPGSCALAVASLAAAITLLLRRRHS